MRKKIATTDPGVNDHGLLFNSHEIENLMDLQEQISQEGRNKIPKKRKRRNKKTLLS